jgi:hypothetical protein
MLVSLVALFSCQNGQIENQPQKLRELTGIAARQALSDYISSHPGIFVSPGRAESAEDIRNIEVGQSAKGAVSIGMFHIDLDRKTYQLTHGYGKPGEGWFEDWQWTGKFILRDGKWELSKPEFTKAWGE